MIRIYFAGTLAFHDPDRILGSMFNWNRILLTYRHQFELSRTRSPYYLFRAISLLQEVDPDLKDKLSIEIWGNINRKNNDLVQHLGIGDIVNIGSAISRVETLNKLEKADILFLPIERPAPKHPSLFIPGKLFEYLSLGKPILVLDDGSEASDIALKSGLGIVVSPDCELEISKMIRRFINQPELLRSFKPDKDYINSFHIKNRVMELAGIIRKLDSQ